MSDQDQHDMVDCTHWGEPGSMPLAHVAGLLRGLQRSIDQHDLPVAKVRVLLGACAGSIERNRAELIAAGAADEVIGEFERALAAAVEPEPDADGA